MKRMLLLLMLPLAGMAMAQDAPTPDTPAEPPRPSLDQTVIGGSFAHAPDGVFSANAAAGVGNVQVNLRSIADGASSGAAAYARQRIDATGADRARDASAVLTGAALALPRGIVGLNQAAGSANAQANVLAIGTRPVAGIAQQIDNLVLASVPPPPAPAAPAPAPATTPLREARIEGNAGRSPAGIFQLNQTAGVGNASANVLVLQLPGSTP